MSKITIISDTHNHLPIHTLTNIVDSDILIHCGDWTNTGTKQEIFKFLTDLNTLPHKHKVIIAGNHDILVQEQREEFIKLLSLFPGITYLEDELIEIEGLKIYGTPWVPIYYDWAFMKTEEELEFIYEKIPYSVDILISHGPPHRILDTAYNRWGVQVPVGSWCLRRIVEDRKPKLHCFGHIHEYYGSVETENTLFINAALGHPRGKQKREPIIIELNG